MKYIFYKFYILAYTIRKGGDPDLRAWFGITIFTWMNIISLFKIINTVIFNEKIGFPKFLALIVILLLLLFYYLMFLYRDKHLKIIEKYKNESDKKRIFGFILIVMYIIISFCLGFYSIYLYNSIS